MNKPHYNLYPLEEINEMRSIDQVNFWFVNSQLLEIARISKYE